jgi:kexin
MKVNRLGTFFLVISILMVGYCTPKKKDPLQDLLQLWILNDFLNPSGPDPLFRYQWHLKNDGTTPGALAGADARVEGAWNSGILGRNVNIVVVDDGVDLRHEDLAAQVNSELNIDFTGQLPTQVNGTAGCDDRNACHGTAVAGIAAAIGNNGRGGKGAAPSARISGRNLLLANTSFTTSVVRSMSEKAGSIYVSNNSWGAPDYTGEPQGSLAFFGWRNAITTGITSGRNNRGALYFWAAGNGGDEIQPGTGIFVDNSNLDGQANYHGVIAVAAIGNDDKKAPYSEEGANLWISAHSEGSSGVAIATTDIMGSAGYNPNRNAPLFGTGFNNNYTNIFNGTSAATPLAAGVAALVLEANPQLTWRDVRYILATTARKVDPTDTDWATNGAGREFNHKYGFGAVDATRAVRRARNFSSLSPFLESSIFPYSGGPQTINGSTGEVNATTVNVSSSPVAKIEYVEIVVNITSPSTDPSGGSGELEIVLTSEAGTSAVLAIPHICLSESDRTSCADYNDWRFGAAIFLDEDSNQVWTLQIRDRCNLATCSNFNASFSANVFSNSEHSLNSWSIKFYGRAN